MAAHLTPAGDQALDSPVDLLEVEQQAVTIPLPLPVQIISAIMVLVNIK